jgi:hypothetical protein
VNRPEYQRVLCETLRHAASVIDGAPGRAGLTQAALVLQVLKEDEFPPDFRADFKAILGRVVIAGRTIEESVRRITDEDVKAAVALIVQLHRDVCAG